MRKGDIPINPMPIASKLYLSLNPDNRPGNNPKAKCSEGQIFEVGKLKFLVSDKAG